MSAGRILHTIKELPLIRPLREARYARRFGGDCYGAFKGVYSSFEEARRDAPSTKHLGFDHPDYPSHHLDRMTRLEPHDYPAMWWLRSALSASSVVFDFGGNVGVHYYAYQQYMPYPEQLSWIVSDLPTLVARGREIAQERGESRLSFVEGLADLERADVFLGAGVLQYVPDFDLARNLAAASRRPRHLLLNKLPLYEGDTFITLQNAGDIVTPQYVWNRTAFLGALEQLGYEVVDSWSVLGYACFVPFHPHIRVPTYTGCYLRQR